MLRAVWPRAQNSSAADAARRYGRTRANPRAARASATNQPTRRVPTPVTRATFDSATGVPPCHPAGGHNSGRRAGRFRPELVPHRSKPVRDLVAPQFDLGAVRDLGEVPGVFLARVEEVSPVRVADGFR